MCLSFCHGSDGGPYSWWHQRQVNAPEAVDDLRQWFWLTTHEQRCDHGSSSESFPKGSDDIMRWRGNPSVWLVQEQGNTVMSEWCHRKSFFLPSSFFISFYLPTPLFFFLFSTFLLIYPPFFLFLSLPSFLPFCLMVPSRVYSSIKVKYWQKHW